MKPTWRPGNGLKRALPVLLRGHLTIALLWLAIMFSAPGWVDRTTTLVGPAVVHSRAALTPDERSAVDSALVRLGRAGLTLRPGQPIYLPATRLEQFALMGTPSTLDLGGYGPLLGLVVIPLQNQVVPGQLDVEVLTHELTHAAVGHMLGRVADFRLPWWKTEGLADYVQAHEREVDMNALLRGPDRINAPSVPIRERVHVNAGYLESHSYFWARVLVTAVLDGPDRPTRLRVDLARLVADTTSPVELARRARRTGMLAHEEWAWLIRAERAATEHGLVDRPLSQRFTRVQDQGLRQP